MAKTTLQKELIRAKTKVSSKARQIHQLIAKFGQSEHTSMLIVVTLPKDSSGKERDHVIGFAGSAEALSKAMIDRAKYDEEFRQVMIDIMYKVQHDIPEKSKKNK